MSINTDTLNLPQQTWQNLLESVRTAINQLETDKGIALINFWAGQGGGKRTLLDNFAEDLSRSPHLRVYGPWDAQVCSKAQMAIDMRRAIEEKPEEKKIFLIDNLSAVLHDGTIDPTFSSFEHSTLAPLVLRDDVLIIIASQHEIRQWRELEVKMRHDSILIPSLTPQEVALAVREVGLDSKKVYNVTCGHRLALNWMITEPDLSADQLAIRLKDVLLSHLPDETRQLALAASLLLHFNLNTLQRAVGVYQKDRIAQSAEDLRRIQHLGREGILVYDQNRSLYRFTDYSVRQLIRRAVYAEGVLNHRDIHKSMTQYYKEEARRPFFLPRYIVNVIYHLASAERKPDPAHITQKCLDWIQQTMSLWATADWNAVIEAWRNVEGDDWAKEEMQAVVGINGIAKITGVLEAIRRNYNE